MPSVLHRRTATAIKMASDRGTFVCCCRLFRLIETVAIRPCYGPFKLTPSYDINLIGVISSFVSYWLRPVTMDAVLATIIASGQARIQLN